MKEIIITALEEGQRLDRLLQRYLSGASSGFIYKMLRKKNITLNGRKALGREKLCPGDCVRIYFSEETLEKFTGVSHGEVTSWPRTKLDIIYEDDNFMLINKPSGMLTQKASPSDVSLNEFVIGYLVSAGKLDEGQMMTFRPSVCNRLDRNTSGIVAAGKTSQALRELSAMFRDRTVHKYYQALTAGYVKEEITIDGFLHKDKRANRSYVSDMDSGQGGYIIKTRYCPLAHSTPKEGSRALTLLEAELITGRSHQIRSQLSAAGHPIIGDPKYGDARRNAYFREKYGLRSQLLHAGKITFPPLDGSLSYLSGRTFTAALPDIFNKIVSSELGEIPDYT